MNVKRKIKKNKLMRFNKFIKPYEECLPIRKNVLFLISTIVVAICFFLCVVWTMDMGWVAGSFQLFSSFSQNTFIVVPSFLAVGFLIVAIGCIVRAYRQEDTSVLVVGGRCLIIGIFNLDFAIIHCVLEAFSALGFLS